jgi:RNA polymerase sigma-70 factor, ECF subfamily
VLVVIAETFTEWHSRLQRFCAQLLQNQHDAEEIVQEVFARLLADPARFDLSESPEVLLFRMARNRCLDARRKQSARNNVDIEAAAPEPTDHGDLEAALKTLPDDERETLLLTAVDGLGYREVAGILNCSLGTIASRRCTAINKLRNRLSL